MERSNRLPNVVTAPAPLSRLAVSRTVLTACSSASFDRTKSSVKTDPASAVTGGLCPQRPKQVKAVSGERCERRQSSLVAVGRGRVADGEGGGVQGQTGSGGGTGGGVVTDVNRE